MPRALCPPSCALCARRCCASGLGLVVWRLRQWSGWGSGWVLWPRRGATGGATPRVLGRQLPLPPPPPLGAFGQQLVAKGVALRRPWAPKAPDAT